VAGGSRILKISMPIWDKGQVQSIHWIDGLIMMEIILRENCRWATKREQSGNIRKNVWLEYDGTRLIVTDWANKLGMTAKTLFSRLDRGWPIEKTLTTPLVMTRRHKKSVT